MQGQYAGTPVVAGTWWRRTPRAPGVGVLQPGFPVSVDHGLRLRELARRGLLLLLADVRRALERVLAGV